MIRLSGFTGRFFSIETLTLAAVLSTALLALVILIELDRALWLDEILALEIIKAGRIFSSLDWEIHPPLFYLVSESLIEILPDLEQSIRFVPYLFLVATVAMIYHIGVVLRVPIPILPVALFLSSQEVFYQGQNFRPYTLLSFIAVLLLHRTITALFNSGANLFDWIGVAVLSLLGVLTHYWFVFLCFGLVLSAVAICPIKSGFRLLVALSAAAISFLIIWGAVFIVQLSHGGGGYPADIALIDSLIDLKAYLPRGKGFFVLIFISLLALQKQRRSHRENTMPVFQFLVFTAFLGLASAAFFSVIKPVFVMKGGIIFAPLFCLALGWWLSSRLGQRLIYLSVLVICLAAVTFSIRNPLSSSWPRTPEVVDFLGSQIRAGYVIACDLSYTPTRYYRDKKELQFDILPLDESVLIHPGWQPRDSNVLATDIAKSFDQVSQQEKFWILFNPEDKACRGLKDHLARNNFQLKEIYSGIGDRFTSVIEARKSRLSLDSISSLQTSLDIKISIAGSTPSAEVL